MARCRERDTHSKVSVLVNMEGGRRKRWREAGMANGCLRESGAGGGGVGDVMPQDVFPLFDGLLHLASAFAFLCHSHITSCLITNNV